MTHVALRSQGRACSAIDLGTARFSKSDSRVSDTTTKIRFETCGCKRGSNGPLALHHTPQTSEVQTSTPLPLPDSLPLPHRHPSNSAPLQPYHEHPTHNTRHTPQQTHHRNQSLESGDLRCAWRGESQRRDNGRDESSDLNGDANPTSPTKPRTHTHTTSAKHALAARQ